MGPRILIQSSLRRHRPAGPFLLRNLFRFVRLLRSFHQYQRLLPMVLSLAMNDHVQGNVVTVLLPMHYGHRSGAGDLRNLPTRQNSP